MAVSSKAIKNRIKSVKNTKKITKAMEMVSAAKMRRAVEATLNTRLYATLCLELLERLSELQEPTFPLLERRPVERLLMVVVTSNRGLCGSFNSNVAKAVHKLLQDKKRLAEHRNKKGELLEQQALLDDAVVDMLGIGRKSAAIARRNNLNLIGVFDTIPERPQIEEILPVVQMMTQEFIERKYDKVVVVYTHFKSSLSQLVKVRQVLPISDVDLEKMAEEVLVVSGIEETLAKDDAPIDTYFLEPSRDAIFDTVIPRLLEVQLFQALLESAASEHSSRMVAMKNASEAAQEMIYSLTLEFNKARQAAITKEIAEIAGGAAALE